MICLKLHASTARSSGETKLARERNARDIYPLRWLALRPDLVRQAMDREGRPMMRV